jgi:hypothetical protein
MCAAKYVQEVFPKISSETTTRKQTEHRDRTEQETMGKAAEEVDAIKSDGVRVKLQERCSYRTCLLKPNTSTPVEVGRYGLRPLPMTPILDLPPRFVGMG